MGTKKKVLIVDDQDEVRKLLRYTLNTLGYELVEANDGPSALEAFKAHSPDVILLDVMMPGGLSGFEVCKQIKSKSVKAPVIIMLTARSQESDREQGEKAGADYYLTKPFSPMKLHKILGSLLGLPPKQ